MKTTFSLYALLLSLVYCGCSKDDSSIMPSYEGVVLNSLTNQPFEGITISVTNGANTILSTSTDNQGEFKFSLNTEDLSSDYYIQIGNTNTEKKQIQITGVGRIKNDLGIIKLTPDTKPMCALHALRVTNQYVILEGELLSSGYSDVTSVGFVVSSSQDMASDRINLKGTFSEKFFTATLDVKTLNPDLTYFFYACAENSAGMGYSEPRLLNADAIRDLVTPTVRWRNDKDSFDYEINVINHSATTLSLRAYIAGDGGNELTEYGFCWSDVEMPTIASSHKSMIGGSVGEYFTITIEGLTPFTSYYFRPYAKNRINVIGYGSATCLTTDYSSSPAQVSLNSNLIVGATQIECNGTASYKNCSLQEVGFCYSSHGDPKISDCKVKADQPQKNYSCLLNNLKEGTSYYVRPYLITTEKDVFYGNVKAVITLVNVKITVVDPNNKPITDASVSIVGGDVGEVTTHEYKTGPNGIVNTILEVASYSVIVSSSPYALKIENMVVNSSFQPLTIKMSY